MCLRCLRRLMNSKHRGWCGLLYDIGFVMGGGKCLDCKWIKRYETV